MKEMGLYIHIPFCKSKCFYCDFNSYSDKEYMQDEYISCVIKEIELRYSILEDYTIKSIFIGGGTPTYLNLNAMEKLLSYLRQFTCDNIEYTCEANPGTLTYEKLCMLKNYGVNRLSIGLQSWDNAILKSLGRIHSNQDFLDNFKLARALGFHNINVDLMFSIHGQTVENFKNTLDNVIALSPEHISCYGLILEQGTPFWEQYKCGLLEEVNEDVDREMYYAATEKLEKNGYNRYEISNYAREGYECIHNIIYWRTRPYLGVGAGAHSFIGSARFSNDLNPDVYIKKLLNSNLPVVNKEVLSRDDMISEFMFMGLRMTEGIQLDDFKYRFQNGLFELFDTEINRLIRNDLLKLKDGRLMLTELGIDLSNQVFVEFLK